MLVPVGTAWPHVERVMLYIPVCVCGEGNAVFLSVCLSVGQFVKYTGYGNAAGLLAQYGLMWRGSCCISVSVCL